MQTILPPSGNTIKILGKPKPAEHGLRWMAYVVAQPVDGGVLVFHTLTRALLLLTPEEYAAPDNLPELRDGWFRVPQEISFSSIQLLIITVLGTFFPLKRFSTVSTKSRPTVITRSLRLQLNLSNHIMASVMNLLLV